MTAIDRREMFAVRSRGICRPRLAAASRGAQMARGVTTFDMPRAETCGATATSETRQACHIDGPLPRLIDGRRRHAIAARYARPARRPSRCPRASAAVAAGLARATWTLCYVARGGPAELRGAGAAQGSAMRWRRCMRRSTGSAASAVAQWNVLNGGASEVLRRRFRGCARTELGSSERARAHGPLC